MQQYISAHRMRGLKSVIYALLFTVKLRTLRFHLSRRKDLIREWAQLEQNNILNINTVCSFVKEIHIPYEQRAVLLAGVEEIRVHSQRLVQELKGYGKGGGKLVFGKSIGEICASYSAYYQCIKTFITKKTILKQLSKDRRIIALQVSNPIVLQEYFQRLVFRSYQIALIVKTYGNYLPNSHSDRLHFVRALEIITNLNKKYDLVIRQGQKEREVLRVQKILGRKIAQELIYSRRCCGQEGEIYLHVFESMLVLEGEGARVVPLDMFSTVFVREVGNHQMVCVVTSNEVCYFLWLQEGELWRFVSTVRKVIACLSVSKSVFGHELKTEAAPFVLARVIDYREEQNLKSCKEEVFVINVSCLKQSLPTDISTSISRLGSSIKQTTPQLSRQKQENEPKELNETVVFTSDQLRQIKCQTDQAYSLSIPSLPITFGGRLTGSSLKMLQWQSYLNRLFRIKSVIENPIWLLKQLQVTEVLYESVVAAQVELGQFQHCQWCAGVAFGSVGEFLECRSAALVGKYSTERHRYCSNVFGRLKGEMLSVPLRFLKNVQEMYLWVGFKEGKVDYAFHKRIASEKRYLVKVVIPSVERTVCQVQVTPYTLVGEVVDEIAFLIGLPVLVGYRLMLCFQGQELLLGANDRILPIVTRYNVDYSKPEGKSFFKRLRSIGSYLQLFEAGVLLLRKVVFCEETVVGNVMSRKWELEDLMSQFRGGKLVGLTKQTVLQMMVLFFLLDRHAGKQAIPKSIKESHLQKYIPLTVDAESEQSYMALHKIYEEFKARSAEEVERLMTARARTSPFYEKYVVELEVVAMSAGWSRKRRIGAVLVGFGWSGVSVFTMNHQLVLEEGWEGIEVRLQRRGLLMERGGESVVLAGRQLYELKNLCGLYKSLKALVKVIKR